jgi:catechol 2,3-dioxygenase-like lactoylglutathione lyase family enzyme
MRLLESPTATELAVATGAASWRHHVHVLVRGDLGGDEALAAALPSGWTLSRADDRTQPTTDLLVVVGGGAGGATMDGQDAVAVARAEFRGQPLLAVVSGMADSAVVVDALDAGADACARTAAAAVIASHLLAMQRRREIERVADLTRM